MPVDPATMHSNMPGAVIMTERPCVRCGYNLIGLEVGGVCPECGTAIVNKKKSVRFSDGLVDAPMWYIKTVALALGLMAIVVVGIIALWLMEWGGSGIDLFVGVAFTSLAALWLAASWIVTIERPMGERTVKDEILDNKHIRLACRVTQGFGLATASMVWGYNLTGMGVFSILAQILMLGVLFGLVPLGVYLSSLADWSGDTALGSRLRGAVWCIAVCGTLMVADMLVLLMPVPFRLLLAGLFTVLSIIVLIGIGLFGLSVLQMSLGAAWAIQNSVVVREREIRVAERKRQRALADAARANEAAVAIAASAAARAAAMDEAIPDAIPLSEDGESHGAQSGGGGESRRHSVVRRAGEHRVGRAEAESGGVDAYELTPEDDEGGHRG